ncbi:hypothetical protein [Pseudophaeobacter sp.]|uniref:hypothetical protein n=1 Tax=Pseudophaeobacter sp. TaxID=1971739 RepID=UPI0032992C47
MSIWVILVLIAASTIGSGLIYKALQAGGRKQADYQAFAQAQGWHYQRVEPKTGFEKVDEFSDPQDDWRLKIIVAGAGAKRGVVHRRQEWQSPQGALAGGEAVLGMPLPQKSVAMLQTGGPMGQQILKAALKATFHALGKTKFDLAIDDATAGDPGGVVMTSEGQAKAMDSLRANGDLVRFRDTHKKAEVPVILRDPEGLKLRRPGAVKDLKDLVALVALGKSLRADL